MHSVNVLTVISTITIFATTIFIDSGLLNAQIVSDTWTQFRGPEGSGKAKSDRVNVELDLSKNVVWRTETPDVGWSSPVTDGERIWITSARTTEATAEYKAAKLANVEFAKMKDVAGSVELSATCLDVVTGRILLQIPLHRVDTPDPIHPMNGYASPTAAIHGDRVVLHFGRYGTWCLHSKTGQEIWHRELVFDDSVGPGSSPVIHNGKVILVCDGLDQQYVTALSLENGNDVWKTPRPPIDAANGEFRKAYSTPLLISVDGQMQAVIPGAQWCVAYDPDRGQEIWRANCGKGYSTTPMPTYADGIVVISTGYLKPELVAIDPLGKGDISTTNILWRESKTAPLKPSMVSKDSRLFIISDSGILSALRISDGSVIWRERLGGMYSASPFVSGDNIMVADHDGNITVFKASESYLCLAQYKLDEQIMASPIPIGNDLMLRTKSAVYRFSRNPKSDQE